MECPMVLLVEDNARLAVLSVAIIEAAGFKVGLARRAFEASGWLQAELEPDAMVTDINLGSGPDGSELAQRARAQRPDLPIVYMSALCADRFPLEARARARFAAKPFVASDVVTALAQTIVETRAEI